MSTKKKELTLQETFYNLCKDLMRYIDKKIVRKYVSPNEAQIPKEKRINPKKYNDNKWRYFFEDEDTTEEEKIKDIFKDNNFLSHLQKLNNDLNTIVSKMDENKTKKENLGKNIKKDNDNSQTHGEFNNQLIKYFIEKNINLNCINQNDVIKALIEIKQNNFINTSNSDKSNLPINKINYSPKLGNINVSKEANKEKENDENSNNENEIKENIITEKLNKNNKENLGKNKVIPNLIQAFDILNKRKKEEKINKLKEKIVESNSSESKDYEEEEIDIEEDEESGDEEEENEEINKKNINKYKNKNIEKEKEFLNKKIKRNKK